MLSKALFEFVVLSICFFNYIRLRLSVSHHGGSVLLNTTESLGLHAYLSWMVSHQEGYLFHSFSSSRTMSLN